MKLTDKVVVVTGSTRGIGRAIAEECAKEGAKVMICSRHEASAQEVSEVLKRQGLSVSGLAADVSVWGDLEKLLMRNYWCLVARGNMKHTNSIWSVANILPTYFVAQVDIRYNYKV